MTSGYMAVLFISIGRMPFLASTFWDYLEVQIDQDPASGSQKAECSIP